MTYRMRRLPRHETRTVRGLAHHVTRWGPESDDPVVLLHGWADTADTFQFLVDALEGDWPLVAFDWRGFGRSAWSETDYWFPDYFADLDFLLDTLCPAGPARLVGHSMGGNIALLYAGIRPERVRSVVSLEGFGLPRSDVEDAPGRYREWQHQLRDPPPFGEFKSYDELAQLLLKRNPRLTQDRAEFIARSWSAETDTGTVRITADPAHKLMNPYRYRRDEAEACWRRIQAPTLLVLAGRSEMLPRLGEDGTEAGFRAAIPGVHIEVLETAGHMLHHEQPEELARVVEAFLGRGEQASR
ncbi:MAG TPA: alpha/beta hydrolase [Steroidobacteraceae bacterium]|nr:alpha/beta hydrolase [Steroidobacteraceae bacterium]